LNDKIGRLLGKMIEVQYGVEPGGVPVEIWLEQLREDRRARGAAARERRAARKAERAQQAQEVQKGHAATPGDPADARAEAQVGVGPAVVAEGGNENGGGLGGQRTEPRHVSVPELPETLEEFRDLVTRALDLEDEPKVAGAVAAEIWFRLHLWEQQEQVEAQWLERLFQEGAANPPDSYPDPYKELRDRAFKIPLILKLDKDFLRWMDQLTARVERCLDWWVSTIPLIERQTASPPATFPAKPPVSGASDQPASGSADRSTAA